jgi:hypothetical protein
MQHAESKNASAEAPASKPNTRGENKAAQSKNASAGQATQETSPENNQSKGAMTSQNPTNPSPGGNDLALDPVP